MGGPLQRSNAAAAGTGAMTSKAPWIDFSEHVPERGFVAMFKGQRYELVGGKPYRRKDGSKTILLAWRTHCAECGDPFEIMTPKVERYPTRRCPAHAARGKRV